VAVSEILLAQHTGHAGSGNGELVMTIFLVSVLVVIWVSLGVVCWIFWRAKKREDEAKLRDGAEWSARSS
jgi:cbb3-type cytochrome oxidase subunit 3